VRTGSRCVLLFLVVAYAALGFVPLGWTFGEALLERHTELAELALSKPAWAALGRSAALGLTGALGAFLLAAPLAFLTGRGDLPARRLFSALALMPLALAPLRHRPGATALAAYVFSACSRRPRHGVVTLPTPLPVPACRTGERRSFTRRSGFPRPWQAGDFHPDHLAAAGSVGHRGPRGRFSLGARRIWDAVASRCFRIPGSDHPAFRCKL